MLSAKEVDSKGTDGDSFFADGDGLYLRCRSGGKSWWFIYTIGGRRRRMPLAGYPAVSLAEARRLSALLNARRMVEEGQDPLELRQQEKLLSALGDVPRTVNELFKRWHDGWLATKHSDGGAYVRRMLERHALPALGGIILDALRAPHIAAVLDKINAGGQSRTAGVVLSNIRQMLAYGVNRGWLPGDPTAGMKKASWGGVARKRERVLSEEEIRDLARKLSAADLTPEIEAGIWLMLAACTRVEETSLAHLKHTDFENSEWRIPPENQKTVRGGNRPHTVFLSPFAKRQLQRLAALPQAHENERAKNEGRKPAKIEVGWLFPATRRPGPMNEKTIAHALNDRQKPGGTPLRGRTPLVDALVLPGGKWTAHDLRRTGSTLMRELGVPQDVIERCLNHRAGDAMVATYQHAKLHAEMRKAWAKLGKRLEELTRL